MDASKRTVIEKKIGKVIKNLEKNNMKAYYVNDREEVLDLVKDLIPKGQTVACGGSMTLAECGIMDLLKNGDYQFLDRGAPGLTREQSNEMLRKAFFSDTYLLSANAITEDGELYNVDGNSNRVAALVFGPASVIVVAGYNKIVPDIPSAVRRVQKIAAPANAVRLHCATPCAKTGECMDCQSEDRVCCNYVLSGHQRQKDRIKVILVGEDLGY